MDETLTQVTYIYRLIDQDPTDTPDLEDPAPEDPAPEDPAPENPTPEDGPSDNIFDDDVPGANASDKDTLDENIPIEITPNKNILGEDTVRKDISHSGVSEDSQSGSQKQLPQTGDATLALPVLATLLTGLGCVLTRKRDSK